MGIADCYALLFFPYEEMLYSIILNTLARVTLLFPPSQNILKGRKMTTQTENRPAPTAAEVDAAEARVLAAAGALAADPDFKGMIDGIESNPLPTTQNNYGAYMALMGRLDGGNRMIRLIMVRACLMAGGNRAGVMAAFKILSGR